MEKFLSVICNSQLFQGIDSSQIEEILHCLGAKIFFCSKGEYLLHAGEPVSSLGLVLSGKVLVIKEDFWGNRNILSSVGPGHCFAETFACIPNAVSEVSVTSDADSEILFLNVQHILNFCPKNCGSHHLLVQNLLTALAVKNLAFTEKLAHLGQRTTRAKLLSYLSAESQKQHSVEFDIPFSRQQLADYLFVERSGLSAELGKMREEGLLEFHKNHFCLKA